MAAKEGSVVLKVREPFSDALLPKSTDELAKFMEQPLTAIAETVTGALAAGPKGWAVTAGHIVQSILKAKLYQQLSIEIRQLRDKGKIPDDFADEKKYKYGFKSWVEVLTLIDEEVPDADRLEALKAMFYSINKVCAVDGEKIVAYQLFQITKRLTSGQLLYLKACYDISKAGPGGQIEDTRVWFRKIGNKLGHHVTGLMDRDDSILIEHGLLTPRHHADMSGIHSSNGGGGT